MRLLILVLLAGLAAAARSEPRTPVGFWEGKLDLTVAQLRIVLTIEAAPEGKFKATLESPDQTSQKIPAEVEWKDPDLVVDVRAVAGVYTAKLNKVGDALEGEFEQGGQKMALVLKKVERPSTTARPQDPKPPFPYRAEAVAYLNKAAEGVTLAGTLTLPEGKGPFPVAILISGSGPQDRDEFLLGHRPFAVIADFLARRGIATLRYDDRGIGESKGDFAKATSADFATDVEAGIAYLKSRSEVDAKRIALIGHSEGGLIAPIVAARNSDVAAIVLLAGTGVNGKEILRRQTELVALASGAKASDVETNRKLLEEAFAIVGANDPAKAEPLLKALAERAFDQTPEEQRRGADKEAAVQQVLVINSPWMRFFLAHEPAQSLAKVKVPVLAINGAKDLQVDPKQNLPMIEKALKEGGNARFEVRELPGLNHLFQKCETGSPAEYAKIDETFNPEALKTVGDWLAKILGI